MDHLWLIYNTKSSKLIQMGVSYPQSHIYNTLLKQEVMSSYNMVDYPDPSPAGSLVLPIPLYNGFAYSYY